jgi:PAS domain S-box-containing protein
MTKQTRYTAVEQKKTLENVETGQERPHKYFDEPGEKYMAEIRMANRQLNMEIAQRREVEKLLESVAKEWRCTIDAIKDAIWMMDIDQTIIRCNKAAAKLFKKDFSKIVGQKCYTLFHGTSQPIKSCPFLRMYRSKKRETVILPVNDRWLSISANPLKNNGGKIIGSVHIITDVTKRKRAERALKKSHDELEKLVWERTMKLKNMNKNLQNEITERTHAEEKIQKLNEELGQHIKELEVVNKELRTFNYSISHDLKTPVIAIEGLSRRLLGKHANLLDTKGQQFLKMINQSTIQMKELIDDLLAFYSLGHKKIEFSMIDVNKMVKEVFEQIKATHQKRKIELNITSLPNASADGTMLRQVITNLLSNAIKYSKLKETTVIEVGGWAKEEKHIYYIKDNGVGFSMEHADKVFEVLERLHSTEEFEGTGIGLAIVKRVIKRHGGEVWAEARVNEGATFYFTLPKV